MALTQLGSVLSQAVAPQEDLAPQRASSKTEYTAKEVEELGIPYDTPPPPPDICPCCGKQWDRKALVFGGRVIIWFPTPTRCDCEESKEYWRQYDEEQARIRAEEADRKRREELAEKARRLLGKSGIKKRFAQRSFDNFVVKTPEQKKCFDIAKHYADTFSERYRNGDGLYIEGTNGTGKTHLAAAIALQLIGNGVPVICKTSGDLLLDIRNTYDSYEGSTEAQVLDVYKRVDLLIIDDLGKEQCSEWSASTLYSILNDRYEDMKPTIITTNYNSDELIRALTPKNNDFKTAQAILSRLQETSRVITMAWKDYRTGG